MQSHPVPPFAEGEYLPPSPHPPRPKERAKALGGTVIGLGLLLAKFKGLLYLLLSVKWILLLVKLGLSGSTVLVSLWFYALAFGWPLAIVFVLLILVHECGHLYAARALGVPVSLPYFIPGLGAFVAMKAPPRSSAQQAAIAAAGPVAGTLAAGACYAYGVATGSPFWIACAHVGFFLNLFNLIPVLPLDGGQIAGAISPRIWLFGVIVFFTFLVATRTFSPFMLLIVVVLIVPSIPRAVRAWRNEPDPMAAAVTPAQRALATIVYFGLLMILGLGVVATAANPATFTTS